MFIQQNATRIDLSCVGNHSMSSHVFLKSIILPRVEQIALQSHLEYQDLEKEHIQQNTTLNNDSTCEVPLFVYGVQSTCR